MKKTIMCYVYSRENKIPYKNWFYSGKYPKTDALGTAGLLLKENYQVMIIPENMEDK